MPSIAANKAWSSAERECTAGRAAGTETRGIWLVSLKPRDFEFAPKSRAARRVRVAAASPAAQLNALGRCQYGEAEHGAWMRSWVYSRREETRGQWLVPASTRRSVFVARPCRPDARLARRWQFWCWCDLSDALWPHNTYAIRTCTKVEIVQMHM